MRYSRDFLIVVVNVRLFRLPGRVTKICQAPPQGIEPCATRVGISSAPSAGDLQAVLHHAQDGFPHNRLSEWKLREGDFLDRLQDATLLRIGDRIKTASGCCNVLSTTLTTALAEPVQTLRESIERTPGGT